MRQSTAHLVLALLAATCGFAFAPAFGGRLVLSDFAPAALVVAVAVGAAVPVAVVGIGRRLELDAVLVAAIGLVVTAAAIAVVTRPGTAAFAGGYRLLTSALPAQADGPARATVAGLVALASLIGSLILAFARQRAFAVVPPLAVLLAALALDAGTGQPPLWLATAVLVLAGGVLAAAREPVHRSEVRAPGRSAAIARRVFPLAGAAAILTAGALLATTFADDLPAVDQKAADARNLVPPPLRPRTAINPMLQYPALAQGVDRVRLTGTSSRRLDLLTLVTLDGFTGRTWTTGAEFRRAGRTLSTGPASPSVRVSVRAVDAAALSWLVRPDRPTALDRDGLGIDESTGDLVVPGGVDYPTRYVVTGTTPVTPSDIAAADTAVRRRAAVSSGQADVPKSVRQFAARARIARTDRLKMESLQALLRNGDGFYVDDSTRAPGGNGYYQLDQLIGARTKHIGTSEQYASAFAVMARYLGYDARLVLGFEPRYASRGNNFTVTGRDIHAWAQVRFARAGWVTFDPTPTRPSSRAKPRPNPAGGNASPTPSSSAPSSPAPPPTTTSAPKADRNRNASGARLGPILLVAALALVIVLVLAPPGLKAGRRRRRRAAAVPAHAVFGAWRDTADRLTEAGAPPQRGRSSSELVGRAPRAVRADVRSLGAVLDKAGYAPEAASDADARTAWEHADTVRHTLNAGRPWWRRLVAALDPRPLWRR